MENQFNLKIFIVDNDAFCLNIYHRQLNNLGYHNVTQFNNSDDCLYHLDQNPDVVFLNYQMDAANQLDLLKKIKRFNPDIYVVFTVTPEEIEAATDALKHGAFDYATKRDSELRSVGMILERIYEIGELLRNSQPSLIKKISYFF